MNIRNFRNKHEGERVFIIGNGPSLRDTDLNKLKNEYTIAMNRIDLIFPLVEWRPSYFVYVRATSPNTERLKSYKTTLDLGIPSFISEDNCEYFPTKQNIMYLKRDDSVRPDKCYEFDSAADIVGECWSCDIEKVVYRPDSSMYVAAQIASYMGFDKMYFVGCDGYQTNPPKLGYSFKDIIFHSGNDPRKYKGKSKLKFLFENNTPIRSFVNGISFKLSHSRFKNVFVLDSGNDYNHFHKKYRNKKDSDSTQSYEKVNQLNRDLIRMHNAIEKIGKNKSFKTYNATVSKNIEIHEPVNFNDIVN